MQEPCAPAALSAAAHRRAAACLRSPCGRRRRCGPCAAALAVAKLEEIKAKMRGVEADLRRTLQELGDDQ